MENNRGPAISIRDATLHNLKNFSCEFPPLALSAVTGPSGSGKSSLVFDVLYGELRRRLLKTPHRDAPLAQVKGAGIALALRGNRIEAPGEMAVNVSGAYAALTELFLNFGVQHCVKCEAALSWLPVGRLIDLIESLPEGTLVRIQSPLLDIRAGEEWIKKMLDRGLSRAAFNGETVRLENVAAAQLSAADRLSVVVDAFPRKPEYSARTAEAVSLCAELSGGVVEVAAADNEARYSVAPRCPSCGTLNKKLGKPDFRFRRPEAACQECAGQGQHFLFEPSRIFPRADETLGEALSRMLPGKVKRKREISDLIREAGCAAEARTGELTDEVKQRIIFGRDGDIRLHGAGKDGLSGMLREQYLKTKRKSRRRRIENYCSIERCAVCAGTRLRAGVRQLEIGGVSLQEVLCGSFSSLRRWLNKAEPRVEESRRRAHFETLRRDLERRAQAMEQLAAGYIELFRAASTLSSGEMQRALCVRQLASPLSRMLYLLDEPTRGLHPEEVRSLTELLKEIVSRGNSIIAVEHDPHFVGRCDYAVALGPGGGKNGGRLLAAGPPGEVLAAEQASLPSGKPPPAAAAGVLRLAGVSKNNLQGIDLEIPLGCLAVLCGASGSGKSTAARDVLVPLLKEILRRRTEALDEQEKRYFGVRSVAGSALLRRVVDVDARSRGGGYGIAAGALAVFEPLREIYASTVDARIHGMQAKHFSFLSPAGRCERCAGRGSLRGEICPLCGGSRYAAAVLEVRYRGRSIAESLLLTVDEALKDLTGEPRIRSSLKTASALGLGYLTLGQEISSLSAGERQRASMVPYLSTRSLEQTLFVFDEPSTGLSVAEEGLLISLLYALVGRGASVLAVDHSLRLISAAQHIIELGPGGGEEGGRIIVQGSPAAVKTDPRSRIAKWIAA